MSQAGLSSRDPNVREPRVGRGRREPSLIAGYNELGVAGRRTGIVIHETQRDENGLEDVDAFFGSSPIEPPPKPSPAPVPTFRRPDLGDAPSTTRSRSSRDFAKPVLGRSPITTSLGTSPRKPASIKRLSTLNPHSTPVPSESRPSQAHIDSAYSQPSIPSSVSRIGQDGVARKLDFGNGASRVSNAASLISQSTSGSKRKRVNEYGESEDDSDNDDDDDPSMLPAAKRQQTPTKSTQALPSTAAPFDHDLMATMYSDEEADEEAAPAVIDPGPEPSYAAEESVYDFPVTDDEGDPSQLPVAPPSGPVESRSNESFQSISNNLPPVDDTVNDPSQAIDISAEDVEPPISSQARKTVAPKPVPPVARKKPRVHPRDRSAKARVSSASFIQERDSQGSPEEEARQTPTDTEPGPIALDSSEDKAPSKPVTKSTRGRKPKGSSVANKSTQPNTGPLERKPGGRSLQVLKEDPRPVNANGRSIRNRIKPINWWCGERVVRSFDGTIQDIQRVEEAEPGERTGSQRTTKTSRGKATRGATAKGKTKSGLGDSLVEDSPEDDEEQEYEEKGLVLCGQFPPFGTDDEKLEEIGMFCGIHSFVLTFIFHQLT